MVGKNSMKIARDLVMQEVVNDLNPSGQNLQNKEDLQGTLIDGIKEVVLSPADALSLIAAGEVSNVAVHHSFTVPPLLRSSPPFPPAGVPPLRIRAQRQCSTSIRFDDDVEDGKSHELKVYSLDRIRAATINFSDSNKLGQGGFGHVYMGTLPGGEEVAVKRFCRNSGQGLEEFKNEVILIAKLQHRNLRLLVWKKQFDIIEAIARGLLYLHRDSRLRVVHRDLKASNILLDADMKPKISDFGMARMFGGDQNQFNTNRVVGTFGYMSTEYTMEVFSPSSLTSTASES
uniref:non-specific serine/threonine protein kinase n=1 Tax=Zea mays TaxID=4577 RepID=A0A804MB88_MAIZE